jgi:polysaccharide biosynthesis transport protein
MSVPHIVSIVSGMIVPSWAFKPVAERSCFAWGSDWRFAGLPSKITVGVLRMLRVGDPDSRYEAAPDLSGLDVPETVRRALLSFKRNFWAAVACALLFAGLGTVYASLQEPYYEAQTSIIIDPRIAESIDPTRPTAVWIDDALVVDSQVEVLRSEAMMLSVVDRLNLAEREAIRLSAEGESVPDENVMRRRLARQLGDSVQVERGPRTFVIHIRAQSTEPELAAEISNTLADAYFASLLETRLAQADTVGDWLSRELSQLQTELHDAELRAERYLFENELPGIDTLNAVEQELADTEQAIISARGRIREAQSEIAIIERTMNPPNGEMNAVAGATLVEALGGTEVVRIEQILVELARLLEVRQARIEITESELAALAQQSRELRADLAQMSELHVGYRQLRRQAEALNSNFETLLARYEQSQRDDRFFTSSARVIQSASIPTSAANRRPVLISGAFGVGGLFIGLGLIFLREQIDDTFRRSDDILTRLNLPYLGPIPLVADRDARKITPEMQARAGHMKRRVRREVGRLTYASAAPFSMLSETLRRTVFSLRERFGENRRVVMLSTSADSGEGKSFFASNLAFFLASQGKRVLLIDGDTRNPYLSRSLVPLLRCSEVQDLGHDTIALGTFSENLSLMFSREYHNSIGDAEQYLRAMLPLIDSESVGEVDFVIVDTAPLAYVSDSLLLASKVDAAILMAAWGKTAGNTLQRVLRMNRPIAEKMLGACLSRVKVRRMKQYEMMPFSDAYYKEGSARPVVKQRVAE